MSNMERPEALAAHSGRVDLGLRNSADSTQNGQREQAPVAVIRKNALEEIRVGLSEFNGHDLLNIRVWAEPRNGGTGTDRIPTKAGIACNVRLLPELIEALRQAEADARAQGLLS
jgi:DNA segregation ATPase FtsK/SpoIIIE-like protein